ncbi:hypothetical protein [Pseudactinotalea sp.]|uniref:hypothetical protein n=1 Tax=Pseudactinotalea sp. TaxID=1926260 RepID=UPI003B3B202F
MSATAQAPSQQGQPPQQAQGQLVPQPPNGVAQQAPQKEPASSAQRVMRISIVTVVVSVLVAALGFVLAQQQSSGLDRAATRADRVLTVMAVRTALLEADGAATNAFLVGGLEPQARRVVYDVAIEEAATGLAALASGAHEDADLIASLNADLTRYTSLVEAARVNNRQGFPVGAAYLDQASTLVREQMLTDLDAVLMVAADDAAADFAVGNWSVVVLVVVIGALLVLVICQVRLATMTRRWLNPGLALATVLMFVALVVGGLGATSSAGTAAAVRSDSYRPTLAVAQASVLAAEARTLESFTLIKRGSGAEFESQFVDRTDRAAELLEAQDQNLADLLQTWLERHAEIRELDDGGNWDDAVTLAVSDEDGGPSQAYAQLAEAASARVDEGAEQVRSELGEASGGARTAAWVLLITGILAAAASWRGLSARREEYR